MINKNNKFIITCILVLIIFLLMPGTFVLADNWKKIDDSSWCHDRTSFFSESVCEVRELTINEPWDKIFVDASPNGSIKVEGWDKDSIPTVEKLHELGMDLSEVVEVVEAARAK